MISGKIQRLLIITTVIGTILLTACRKTGDTALPEIEIILPETNSIHFVPGSLNCGFSVHSPTPLKTLKINITNDMFIPEFGDVILKPRKNDIDTSFAFYLKTKPVEAQATYYFHISAENSAGVKNKYSNISLANKTPELTDILYVRTNDNNTDIINNRNEVIATIKGICNYMAFIPDLQSLIIETNRPATLKSIDYPGTSQNWEYKVQNDVTLSGLQKDDRQRILYCPRSDGSVYGFDYRSGNLRFTTAFMQDTVPTALVITPEYLFGEFKTLHNGKILWITFYKGSGKPFFKQETGSPSQFLLPYNGNTVAIIRETAAGSSILFYDTEKQKTVATQQIPGQTIIATCPGPDSHLFLATDSQLFFADEFTVQKTDACFLNKPLSLKYYNFDNKLYIFEKGHLTVLKWPECTTVTENYVDEQIYEFQPVYSYEP